MQPVHIDPKDVELHDTNNSKLSASIAGTSLPAVVLSDEEKAQRLEEKKQRKEERKGKQGKRRKKLSESLKRRCKEKKLGG